MLAEIILSFFVKAQSLQSWLVSSLRVFSQNVHLIPNISFVLHVYSGVNILIPPKSVCPGRREVSSLRAALGEAEDRHREQAEARAGEEGEREGSQRVVIKDTIE